MPWITRSRLTFLEERCREYGDKSKLNDTLETRIESLTLELHLYKERRLVLESELAMERMGVTELKAVMKVAKIESLKSPLTVNWSMFGRL